MITRATTTLLDTMIAFYQRSFSLLLGERCRFYPSCSAYARECLRRYPLATATLKATRRICRCHPFHPGGVDLP